MAKPFRILWFGITLLILVFGSCGTLVDEGGGLSYLGLEHWCRYEYGWPFVFTTRHVGAHRGVLTRFNPLSGNGVIKLSILVSDALIVLLIAVATAPILAHFLRRRFTLRGILLFIALLSFPLAHLAWTITACRSDQELSRRLERCGCGINTGYVGPRWLARLSGTTTPFGLELYGTTSVSIEGRLKNAESVFSDMSRLKFLRWVTLPDGSDVPMDRDSRERLLLTLDLDHSTIQD